MVFQCQGAGEIGARGKMEQTVFRQTVNGGLDGGGVLGDPVPHRAEIGDTDRGADFFGGKFQGLLPLTGGYLQPVGRPGPQGKEGEHIGVSRLLPFPVQPEGVFLRGVIGGVIL